MCCEATPQAPFDPPQQFAREQAIFGDVDALLRLALSAVLSVRRRGAGVDALRLALAVWQAVTLGLYLLTIGAILKHSRPAAYGRSDKPRPTTWLWLLLALAFPAVLINIGHGQNGFLTAALLGGALVVLDRRPLVAGILFGLLVYKPQYGLMIPLVLAVERPLALLLLPPRSRSRC